MILLFRALFESEVCYVILIKETVYLISRDERQCVCVFESVFVFEWLFELSVCV